MGEIFETIMLICFGLSWPISVVKNIRSKTAKSMSLQFILLIMVGYIAGITSRILSGATGYIITVYLVNLFFVTVNLIVYFINRTNDKKLIK